jgi:multisubunit Na+/H+ antiporter MnhG subunit
VGVLCIVVALFIGEEQKLAVGKAVLVALLLFFMNAVITHATARAHYVREKGVWPPKEKLEVVDE